MNQTIFDKLNEEIAIHELVEKSDVVLKRKGKNFMGLCPFHSEKTPSFSVSVEKNIAVCMACRKGGKPLTFYSQLKQIPLPEAAQQLAELFNFDFLKKKIAINPLTEILNLTQNYFQKSLFMILEKEEYQDHPVRNYLLNERKLTIDLIKEFKMGYAYDSQNALTGYLLKKGFKTKDLLTLGLIQENIFFDKNQPQENQNPYYDFFKDRIIFPITNLEGKTVGFCGRTYNNKQQAKYLFNIQNKLFQKNNLLYRFHEHQKEIEEKKELFLCEGFFDVIAFYQIGMKNTVATLGTNLNQQQAAFLKTKVKKIILSFDGDKAGQEANQKAAELLNKNKIITKIFVLPEGKDPDQYISDNIRDINFLKDNIHTCIKDYIFYHLEELKQQDLSINQIQKKIGKILQNHDIITMEYYQKKIYEKFNEQINLVPGKDLAKEYIIFLEKQKDKMFVEGEIPVDLKSISLLSSIFKLVKHQSNNFIAWVETILEKLYDEYLELIEPDVLELIRGIKKYFLEEIENLEIKEFKFAIFKTFLQSNLEDKFNNSEKIYHLLSKVEKNLFLDNKKTIKREDFLKQLFLPFALKKKLLEINRIKKAIREFKEKLFETDKEINQEEKDNLKQLENEFKQKNEEFKQQILDIDNNLNDKNEEDATRI
ncbi:DNA primase ['Camptotheca acuminata' phytoplasma]|uniref:DNA primase n=1 Tax='Camptotheca acuminata' phytoplasma TaxID=3239192 RepID=UPI00351A85CA